MAFDPYEAWLGIDPERRPPSHYDLLGLPNEESNATRIDQAALRRIAKVRQYQIGPHSDLSQQVLTELARARLVLMDPHRKAEYDASLRGRVEASIASAASPAPRAPETSLEGRDDGHAEEGDVFAALNVDDHGSRPRRSGGSVVTLPAWQVNLIRGTLFAVGHLAVVGGFLYATGYGKTLMPRVFGPAAEASVAPVVVATNPVPARAAARPPEPRRSTPVPPPAGRPAPAKPAKPVAPEADDGFAFAPEDRTTREERPGESVGVEGADAPPRDPVATAGDSPAEATLRAMRLKKSGRFFYLEGEAAVFERLEEARAAHATYRSDVATCDAIQQSRARLDAWASARSTHQSDIDMHQRTVDEADRHAYARTSNSMIQDNAQLARVERDRLRALIRAGDAEAQALRDSLPRPHEIEAAFAQRDRDFEALRDATQALRKAVDSVADEIRTIKQDARAKAALAAMDTSPSTLKIDLSDRFNKALSDLVGLERMFKASSPARKPRR